MEDCHDVSTCDVSKFSWVHRISRKVINGSLRQRVGFHEFEQNFEFLNFFNLIFFFVDFS